MDKKEIEMSKDEKKTKVKLVNKKLDLTNLERGMWLVKVPKYIAKKWEKAPSDMNVGKLRITNTPGRKAQVSMSLTSAVVNLDPEEKIPTEHTLDVLDLTKQTLGVFSHGTKMAEEPNSKDSNDASMDAGMDASIDSKGATLKPEKICMEGHVVQKLECRPIPNECYMKLKLDTIKKAAEPKRIAQPINKIVQNFKPIKDHAHNIEYRERKKAEGKHTRGDKNSVMEMLYNAFEKHQYYNIKDLAKITKQPIGYLKEILKELCDYNKKFPHKNTWELKKEYRHYSTDDKKDEEKTRSKNNSD